MVKIDILIYKYDYSKVSQGINQIFTKYGNWSGKWKYMVSLNSPP